MSEYLLQIQTIVDSLSSIGVTISSYEHLDVILEGLPREYECTMSLICSKFEPLSIDEVETLLLGDEVSRLDKFQKPDSLIVFILLKELLLLIVLLIFLKELQLLIISLMLNLFKWFKIFRVPLMAVPILRTLILKPILLKEIKIILLETGNTIKKNSTII